jgi:two-component system, NarL family, sensor histidine kinase UhpB
VQRDFMGEGTPEADNQSIATRRRATMTHSCRILHIEDSLDDSKLVQLALRKAPFEFTYVRVDAEAGYVAQLEGTPPDVILCDYDLPGFSAERALDILRERGVDISFIIVSQHIDESTAVVAMQHGASDYLAKRNLGRLPKAIEAALDRRHARAEIARAQEELRASESMKRSILDSLMACIAMVDGQGVIMEVNKAWQDRGGVMTQNGLRSVEMGENYLDFLREKADCGSAVADAVLEGTRAVIARERAYFSLEYPLVAGAATRWFVARALPLERSAHGAVVSHRDITERMMTHIALDQAHKRMKVLSKRVLSIQEEERRGISRDLHDDVGQSLTALKIGLHRLSYEPPATREALVAECMGVADATLDKLRQIALDLRPPQLDQLGLADALVWLVERQRGATGLDIACDVAGLENRRPPAALEIACYRIVQEALNNATRHAGAKRIVVRAHSDGTVLKLSVRDDGTGFDTDAARQRVLKSGSLGLISMEERTQLAGGRMKLHSRVGFGTTLSVVFPVDASGSHYAAADVLASPA